MIYEPLPEKDLLDIAYEKASAAYRATEQFFLLNKFDNKDDKLMTLLPKNSKSDGDYEWTWIQS